MDKQHQIAIIGGGIAGLTAAFYLQKEATERSLPLTIRLIEASSHIGGKIETLRTQGMVMETGPDSFLERKTSAKQLAIDLGLEQDLIRNNTGQAYILHDFKLHPIPEGSVMGIPTRLTPFVKTGLFSSAGKMRAAGDLVLSRGVRNGDISVGAFFRRRLGDEVVDRLIEPLLSGIYAGSLDHLSLEATFPQFAEMEKKHRSLILGMRKSRPQSTTGRTKGQFLTLKNGLLSFAEEIEAKLPVSSVLKNSPVRQVEVTEAGYRLHIDGRESFNVDAVILATPFKQASQLLPQITWSLPPNDLPATSVATVLLAYDEQQVPLKVDGTGFVVPRGEDTTITACTWTHRKWPHTVPKGKGLIRCYVGRSGDEAIVEEPDEVIVAQVQKDLKRILSIDGSPEFTLVTRWPLGMPQYTVGHVEWEKHVHEEIAPLPGLFLAGASYGGVGIPDCIDQGKQAVQNTLHFLSLQ
ncbi:oxygen-dependent protoporphyrinogen oxidase [Marininema mesophilum]|uniref:Coproporphyrinogen III oxidase n=1 Tax=Marininema mesophilum TaxID=1048340 RepID=A0A1H2ZKS0_9BACL|nr:protoporphyrinogen oxidase [Marininema mesophilum]SDX17404.1 oxygen-dependent protoporphyrinogen oxidase [Marininema mesophilum]